MDNRYLVILYQIKSYSIFCFSTFQQQKVELEEKLENMTPEQKLAEKLRLQKIQQEEDLKTALDTFGVTESPSGLDGMHPTNKAEFSEFAQALCKKILNYSKSDEFPGFVEEFVRNICVNCKYFLKILISFRNF